MLEMAQIQDARKAHAEAEQRYEQAHAVLDTPNAAQHLSDVSDVYAHSSAFHKRRGQSKRTLELITPAWQFRDGVAAPAERRGIRRHKAQKQKGNASS